MSNSDFLVFQNTSYIQPLDQDENFQSLKPIPQADDYQVCIRMVTGVKEGDFNQAGRTLLACLSAGLDGIKLVTEALEKGCGYSLTLDTRMESFYNLKGRIVETRISDQAISAFNVRGSGPILPQSLNVGEGNLQGLVPLENQLPYAKERSASFGNIDLGVILKRKFSSSLFLSNQSLSIF